jgi:predicted nucleic acid-binding protein
MGEVFADTGYWVAVLDPKDQLHERAQDVSRGLGKRRFVTTEMVLAELLRLLAKPPIRERAAEAVEKLLRDPNVDVVPQTGRQFLDAFGRYRSRTDKAWSLTDCASFLVMEQRNIKDALAYDQHFEQAGFVALLRI